MLLVLFGILMFNIVSNMAVADVFLGSCWLYVPFVTLYLHLFYVIQNQFMNEFCDNFEALISRGLNLCKEFE
jgi:hypothetical protein